MNDVRHADMNGLRKLHIDLWAKLLNEPFVGREHLVEILWILNEFLVELGHFYADVGRLIDGQTKIGGDGKEAELFVADDNANIEGSHGCLL